MYYIILCIYIRFFFLRSPLLTLRKQQEVVFFFLYFECELKKNRWFGMSVQNVDMLESTIFMMKAKFI